MIKKLIKRLTIKRKAIMTKNPETPVKTDNNKELKNFINALKTANSNLKIIQKQFSFNDEHFISVNIKENDELLNSL